MIWNVIKQYKYMLQITFNYDSFYWYTSVT